MKTLFNSSTLLKNKTMTNNIKAFLCIESSLRDLPMWWKGYQASSDLVISWGEFLVDVQPGTGPESMWWILVFCAKTSALFTWLVYLISERLSLTYPLHWNKHILLTKPCLQNSISTRYIRWLFGFHGISTFVGYLIPNPFLYK